MITVHKDGKGVSLSSTSWGFNLRRVTVQDGKKTLFAATAGYYDRDEGKYKDFAKTMWLDREDLEPWLEKVDKLLEADLPKPPKNIEHNHQGAEE